MLGALDGPEDWILRYIRTAFCLYLFPMSTCFGRLWFQYSIFQTKTVLENGDIEWGGITFDLLNFLAADLNFR